MNWIKRHVPSVLSEWLKGMWYAGSARFCPVCKRNVRTFLPFGVPPRPDARCPACGSLERHRLVWIFFRDKTNLFSSSEQKVLHVAPEPAFVRRLTRLPSFDYVTADISDPRASIRMDVMDIQLADNTFDVIYCSHVLEHVEEDRRAMRELHRVLKPTGWAILQAPITAERTFENSTVTDPAERERVYGQADHVRRYGPDYVDRLGDAGFNVTRYSVADLVDGEEAERMGVREAEDVFYCTKARAPGQVV